MTTVWAFTPQSDGTFLIGSYDFIIGYWEIKKQNNFDILSFSFNNNLSVVNNYSCILLDDIPQDKFSVNIGEGEYPIFLNLFIGNTWTSYIQNQICLLYKLGKNPISNYSITPKI